MNKQKLQIPIILGILLLFVLLNPILFSSSQDIEITYKEFRDKLAKGQIDQVEIANDKIIGKFKLPDSLVAAQKKEDENFPDITERIRLGKFFESHFRKDLRQPFIVVALPDDKLVADLQAAGVDYKGIVQSNWIENLLLYWIFPLLLLFVLWGFIFRRMGGGGNVMNIGKSKAKIYAADSKTRVTFADVAGVEEVID